MSSNQSKETHSKSNTKKPRRLWLKIILLIFLLASIGLLLFLWRVSLYPDQAQEGSGQDIAFSLPAGKGPQETAELLASKGIVDNATRFAYYLRFSGRFNELKAGDHLLSDTMTPRQIMDALSKPPQAVQVNVTIPEGKTIREMASFFESAGVCSATSFIQTAKDASLAKEAGLSQDTFEGFLFPNTYRFRPNTSPKEVVLTMHEQFKKMFSELTQKYAKNVETLSRDLNFSDRDIVILASIVEKETGAESERGFVASVFLNRLLDPSFTPKYLATDPTIVYGLAESKDGFDGDIKSKDLTNKENRYNTYVHPGLPPGPITNFGRAALEAVLNPPATRCYYFVAKGDGSSFFSETVTLHEKAVDIFQRRLRGARAKTLLKDAPDCTKEAPTYKR